MKTKAILATLLVVAAASADARFAWPYPQKTVSPDESGHWVVINGNAWSHDVESEFTTWNARRGEASPSGGGPDGLKSSPSKEKYRRSRNDLPRTGPKNRERDFTFPKMSIFERLRK